MNNGPLLFLGVLITLATSFWGLILAPQLQFGRQQPVVIEATGESYPPARPGQAARGAEVYRSLGCVECHSQQVRQTGVHFDVWVSELTTNADVAFPAVAKAQSKVGESEVAKLLGKLPARFAAALDGPTAQDLARRLTEAGAKAEPVIVTLGPDIQRGWGPRLSVSQDYLRDYPVQLGQLRLGPDLASYGTRQTNMAVVLRQLYATQVPGSIMPPYRFLFTKRSYTLGDTLPADAVVTSPAANDKAGEILVPGEEAVSLAAYLLSLRAEAPLFEAPVGKPPAPKPVAVPVPAPAVP
jgi:cbb3-type cytochrome oxidase cytochrome c subunit